MLKEPADKPATPFVLGEVPKDKASAEAKSKGRVAAEATFKEHVADPREYIQNLIGVARGVQLILENLPERKIDHSVAWALADVLSIVIEPADAYFFESVGELNSSILEEHLEILLERDLAKVREKIDEEER